MLTTVVERTRLGGRTDERSDVSLTVRLRLGLGGGVVATRRSILSVALLLHLLYGAGGGVGFAVLAPGWGAVR